MKVCVFGTGAIGGYLAARLADSDAELTCIARGKQLEAIRSRGLTLIENDSRQNHRVNCTDQPAEAGPQDVVFITLKSHTVPAAAAGITELLGPDTAVVTAYNGVPWWFFYGHQGSESVTLESVDPGRGLWDQIGPERAIGCVVYPAARVVEPGVIEHQFGNRFAVGEPDGNQTPRLESIAAQLVAAGLEAPLESSIRTGICTKLVANASYNPVSVLTGSSLGRMINDVAVNRLLCRMMQEGIEVAASLGISVPLSPAELLEATRPLGEHKTSMLQDLEAGRSLELDPIVGAVQELGRLHAIPTPTIDIILALAKQKATLAGCYPAAILKPMAKC